MRKPSDQYLQHLSERWRRSTADPNHELVDSLFRELLASLGPFTPEEIDVFCRGTTMAALAACMAGLARRFSDTEEILSFVQLVACRAAVEAENARRA